MSDIQRPRRTRGAVRTARLCVLLCLPLACAGRGSPAGTPTPPRVAPRAAPDTSSAAITGVKTVERLFTGRFPGVSVTQASNGGLQIRIRGGANSFMAGEEPLYLVDGSPLPQGTGGIVFLNPYDIETIEVLKNPADTGLYGVRGANGVIRITTLRPGRR